MDELLNKKNQLLSELSIQYKNLVNFLMTVPVDQQFKAYAFQNLDQGIMWFHKGIELLNLIDDKKLPEKEPEVLNEVKPVENEIIN